LTVRPNVPQLADLLHYGQPPKSRWSTQLCPQRDNKVLVSVPEDPPLTRHRWSHAIGELLLRRSTYQRLDFDGIVLRISDQNSYVWSCFPRPKMQSLCIAPMTSPRCLEVALGTDARVRARWKYGQRRTCSTVLGEQTYLAYSAS
jgi:hypothetical protein